MLLLPSAVLGRSLSRPSSRPLAHHLPLRPMPSHLLSSPPSAAHSSTADAAPRPSASPPGPPTTASVDYHPRILALVSRMQDAARKTILHRQRLAEDRVRLSSLGSVQSGLKVSQPSFFRNHPPDITNVTLDMLITVTAHLGHHSSLDCPTNYPLIHGTRSGISIIDLRHTLSYLRRACNVLRETVLNDGIILFANGVKGSERAIKLASERLEKNGYWLGQRPNGRGSTWVRGTLTNAAEVLKGPRQLAKQLMLDSENSMAGEPGPSSISRRRQQAGNLEALKFLPALIVVFDPKASKVLLREAALKQIPTIGVIDTDVDPRVVTYPIPANDDSIRSIELISGVLSKAGQEGLKRRMQSYIPTGKALETRDHTANLL